jgi:hypothetical protein
MATEHTAQSEPIRAATADPMPPPCATAADEALDAIVYDVHPALLPAARRQTGSDDYPYGPRVPYDFETSAHGASSSATAATVGLIRWISDATGQYIEILNRPPDFVVPKTFGMSAILGIMTALAVLFGCLRWMNAFPVLYFFFGVQALAICLVQMFYGQTPRLASIIAGAIILPVFTVIAAVLNDRFNPGFACAVVGFVPVGALLGYLTGTCAAGVFLVMDYLEPYLQGQAFHARAPAAASPASTPAAMP